MTTTDPTQPHICTADGGPACPSHTPNCEPGCAQPAAADSTGRPPRASAGASLVSGEYDEAAAHHDALLRQVEQARAENARLRSQLAEARQSADARDRLLRQAAIDRDEARAGLAREREAAEWRQKCIDEAIAAIHDAPQEIAPLLSPVAPADLPRAVRALIDRARSQLVEALVRALTAETERDEARDRLRTLIDEVWRHIGQHDCGGSYGRCLARIRDRAQVLAATTPETAPTAPQTDEQTQVRTDTHTGAETGSQGPLDGCAQPAAAPNIDQSPASSGQVSSTNARLRSQLAEARETLAQAETERDETRDAQVQHATAMAAIDAEIIDDLRAVLALSPGQSLTKAVTQLRDDLARLRRQVLAVAEDLERYASDLRPEKLPMSERKLAWTLRQIVAGEPQS